MAPPRGGELLKLRDAAAGRGGLKVPRVHRAFI